MENIFSLILMTQSDLKNRTFDYCTMETIFFLFLLVLDAENLSLFNDKFIQWQCMNSIFIFPVLDMSVFNHGYYVHFPLNLDIWFIPFDLKASPFNLQSQGQLICNWPWPCWPRVPRSVISVFWCSDDSYHIGFSILNLSITPTNLQKICCNLIAKFCLFN